MTPKQKAEQLVYEMYHVDVVNSSEYGMEWNMAKQCALIAVDEVLNYIERINNAFNLNLSDADWNEVKQEIEKL